MPARYTFTNSGSKHAPGEVQFFHVLNAQPQEEIAILAGNAQQDSRIKRLCRQMHMKTFRQRLRRDLDTIWASFGQHLDRGKSLYLSEQQQAGETLSHFLL